MERRFFYHAFGVGLGGRITLPSCELIEAQAATALPTVGGYASSRVDGYRFRDIVSVRSATAYAVGSKSDNGSYNTSITVSVEGLNILGVITAELITARLTSKHGRDGEEPTLSAIGSEFRGLRISGNLIDVKVPDPDLHFKELTPTAFNRTAAAKAEAAKKEANASQRAELSEFLPGPTGNMMCSLVKTASYAIRVPTVGTVYLGEVLASGYERRLTMVRVELGCPVEGGMEFASGGVNGYTLP